MECSRSYRPGMDARSSLISAIAFALLRCKALFRVMAQSHNTDEARHAAAEIIADQIELANFEVRQKPPRLPHSTP